MTDWSSASMDKFLLKMSLNENLRSALGQFWDWGPQRRRLSEQFDVYYVAWSHSALYATFFEALMEGGDARQPRDSGDDLLPATAPG